VFKNRIDKILKQNVKKRNKILSNDLDNVVFLDFDGVINLDSNNYAGPFYNAKLINNLNKFCLKYNFKIVVISSWRKYSNYREILYNSGLDKKIPILGCTESLETDRELEVIEYLKSHYYIDKFIILDDKPFQLLKKYQVQTLYNKGFNEEKYAEAVMLLEQLY
jgi:hypothetical protein